MSYTEGENFVTTQPETTYMSTVKKEGDAGGFTPNDWITIIAYALIGTAGIIGNTLVLVVFRFLQARRSRVNFFILNQALADLITSLCLVAFGATRIFRNKISPSEFICRFWWPRFFVFSGFAVSTFNLTAMSLERFVAVLQPLKYPRFFSKRNTRIVIVFVWILGPIMQWIFPIFLYEYNYEANSCGTQTSYTQIVGALSGVAVFLWEYLLPVVFMGFAYVSILHTLKKKESQIRAFAQKSAKPNLPPPQVSNGNASNNNKPKATTSTENTDSGDDDDDDDEPVGNKRGKSGIRFVEETKDNTNLVRNKPNPTSQLKNSSSSSKAAQARRRNVTVTLFIIFIVYVACWTPNQFTFLQFNLGGPLNFDGLWYHFTVVLAFLNTCVNPFIYAMKHKQFQKGLRQICNCWQDKSESSSLVASVSGTAID